MKIIDETPNASGAKKKAKQRECGNTAASVSILLDVLDWPGGYACCCHGLTGSYSGNVEITKLQGKRFVFQCRSLVSTVKDEQ